jgi:hypothetical protein
VINDDNPGVQEWPTLVRRNPIMQAPLRKGKKEETLGRAEGVTRTGRSLLFGLLLIAIATVSSLVYTWERLVVESMLRRNAALARQLELVEKRSEVLAYSVARLEARTRIVPVAEAKFGMTLLDWDDVIVIEDVGGK